MIRSQTRLSSGSKLERAGNPFNNPYVENAEGRQIKIHSPKIHTRINFPGIQNLCSSKKRLTKFPFTHVIFPLVIVFFFEIVVLRKIPAIQVRDLRDNKASNLSLLGFQATKVLAIHSIISMLRIWKDDNQVLLSTNP